MAGMVAFTGWAGLTTQADTKPNSYQSIVDRNPFGLRPPAPPAPEAPPAPAEPPPNLSFTGITGDGQGKKAWIMANVTGKQPGPVYYSLGEREKQDDLEVVEINAKAEEVKILLRGEPVTLTFKNNANKTKPTAPVAVASQPFASGVPMVMTSQPANTATPVNAPVMVGRHGATPAGNGHPGISQPSGTAQEHGSGLDVAARQTAAALINNRLHEARGIPMPSLPGVVPP